MRNKHQENNVVLFLIGIVFLLAILLITCVILFTQQNLKQAQNIYCQQKGFNERTDSTYFVLEFYRLECDNIKLQYEIICEKSFMNYYCFDYIDIQIDEKILDNTINKFPEPVIEKEWEKFRWHIVLEPWENQHIMAEHGRNYRFHLEIKDYKLVEIFKFEPCYKKNCLKDCDNKSTQICQVVESECKTKLKLNSSNIFQKWDVWHLKLDGLWINSYSDFKYELVFEGKTNFEMTEYR